MDKTFLLDRLAATRLQIIAYEEAALALAGDGIQSYILDTGQTRQNVTKLDLEWIQKTIDSLYNRCATLDSRLNNSGTSTAVPAW